MPKEEIGAAAFMRQYPEYDGRGVVVAVLDTGVDPGAKGLQICPDGRPKMLDVLDCTGAGDVDTRTTAAAAEDGTLKGLTGRTLKLPASWPTIKPGEKYHLGLKRAFELYPGGLGSRVKAERRKSLDAAQREAVAKSQSVLHAEKPDESSADGKKRAAELKSRVALLQSLEKEYDDAGPLYDVCAYLDDADRWRICVDTSEAGELGACKLLEPFRVSRADALAIERGKEGVAIASMIGICLVGLGGEMEATYLTIPWFLIVFACFASECMILLQGGGDRSCAVFVARLLLLAGVTYFYNLYYSGGTWWLAL